MSSGNVGNENLYFDENTKHAYGQAYYESVLSNNNKQSDKIGGLAIESPDMSKISLEKATENLNLSNNLVM